LILSHQNDLKTSKNINLKQKIKFFKKIFKNIFKTQNKHNLKISWTSLSAMNAKSAHVIKRAQEKRELLIIHRC